MPLMLPYLAPLDNPSFSLGSAHKNDSAITTKKKMRLVFGCHSSPPTLLRRRTAKWKWWTRIQTHHESCRNRELICMLLRTQRKKAERSLLSLRLVRCRKSQNTKVKMRRKYVCFVFRIVFFVQFPSCTNENVELAIDGTGFVVEGVDVKKHESKSWNS